MFPMKALSIVVDARPDERCAVVTLAGVEDHASMGADRVATQARDWTLRSNCFWLRYLCLRFLVMESYRKIGEEAVRQFEVQRPLFPSRRKVPGLGIAVGECGSRIWGKALETMVVAPEAVPRRCGRIPMKRRADIIASGPAMARPNCTPPSFIALTGLARDADLFSTRSEEEAHHAVTDLAEAGVETMPPKGAGLAAMPAELDFNPEMLSEGRGNG